MARDTVQVTATGDAQSGAGPWYLHQVTLTPAAAVSTLEVRDGSGGAVRLKLQAAAGGNSATWNADRAGVLFRTAIHATLSGTGAVASFTYS